MTEQLITTYPTAIQSLTLVPADGGRFELSIDGELIYSKLKTGAFPEWKQIQPLVQARLK